MNWLEALDTIESTDNLQTVFRAMDKLTLAGKFTTYQNIAEVTGLTEHQVEGILRRFRAKYSKDNDFVTRAKIIAAHFGANGKRKVLG